MKLKLLILLITFICYSNAFSQEKYETAKPWTYWYWMGNTVNKNEITIQLEEFANAGLGGVQIIPIYGVKGYEDEFQNWLSEEWMESVRFTIDEAEKLKLGVDITLGTGWPYGGSWITPGHAAKELGIIEYELENGALKSLSLDKIKSKHNLLEIIAIYAYNGKKRINLTPYIENDLIKHKLSRSDWELNIFFVKPTEQMVKRAAPGGEGFVLDYFEKKSVNFYLQHIDSVFSNSQYSLHPRAFYHDSYEVYRANWTVRFLDAFKEQHDYDLLNYIFVLNDTSHSYYKLIVHDIRATIAELLYSGFTKTWTDWSKDHKRLSRNQAHGSPGNLLDLYALASIPETESFGCSEFDIPGLFCDPDYNAEKFGRPSPLMMKFASSPAHILGKPLVSSETATWLGEHFKVALKRVKPQVDELFTAGINHIFYQGTTYTPTDENYPGWLFYASTNFGRNSHFRDEFPLLNNYIENIQKPMQKAFSDNDILLYFPINDLWTNYRAKKRDILFLLDVHHYEEWYTKSSFGETAEFLWENGYGFDYISDRQINRLKVDNKKNIFIEENNRYQTILIPKTEYIPASTLDDLTRLGQQGCKIIFVEDYPKYYPGFSEKKSGLKVINNTEEIFEQNQKFILAKNLSLELGLLPVRKEELKNQGLDFIRKKNQEGYLYFIANLGNQFTEDSLSLAVPYQFITITDPLTNRCGYIETDDKFYLDLPPGKSLLIQTSIIRPEAESWSFYHTFDTIKIEGLWNVQFADFEKHGLQKEYQIEELKSWTNWGDEALMTYCGKASYVSKFSLNQANNEVEQYTLHIEDVRESAKVIINGTDFGTIWSIPYLLEIPPNILKSENQIEIIVQNLSSNYMKKYDEENPGWKKFYDINFVNITYDEFSTRHWEYESSGIIGKIFLTSEK